MVANFAMFGLVWLITELDSLLAMAKQNKALMDKHGAEAVAAAPNSQEAFKIASDEIDGILEVADNLLKQMHNAHIQNAMDRLRLWTTKPDKRWDTLFERTAALHEAIRIECEEYLFYIYPKPKGQKLRDWESNWETITTAFPEAVLDSYYATDCYSLGQDTASVFHSMRVAEIGLRALAKERHVRLPRNKHVDWATWGEIIHALEGKAKLVRNLKAGTKKDAELEFYSGVLADLNGFKDEYRNLVMHSREIYDEFQAARALSRVHDFMGRLALSSRIKRGKVS